MAKPVTVIIIAILAWATTVAAASKGDGENFDSIYQAYLRLYGSVGNDDQFYSMSAKIKQHFIDQHSTADYYKTELNEVLYDIDHGKSYNALQKANAMLARMKEEHYSHYEMVYAALGNLFESRGCYRMARHYYQEAIDNADPNDEVTIIGLFSQMAVLQMFNDPKDAWLWNERCGTTSKKYPHYHQVYLFVKAATAFASGDRKASLEAIGAYHQFHRENAKTLDNFGQHTIKAIEEACRGNNDRAIALLAQRNTDIDTICLNQLRILVCKHAGQYQAALRYAGMKADYIDSLNSDMLFNNINQLNAETDLAKMQSDASRQRARLYGIVLALAGIIIVLLVVYIITRSRSRKNLSLKNEQLKMALSMAEESDKMKTEFVRSVSHEIRTPLNAINGFNEIINNKEIELSEEEKSDLLNRIKDNVQAITNIVDEMLQTAEKGSTDFYNNTGTIHPNQFLSSLIYSKRNEVSPKIELYYTTKIINRYTIQTNQDGVQKIVEHLINNAIKFTTEGYIEVHCEESPSKDHLLISVSDTGSGVAPEKQEKIFEQFFKADSFQQGIGLGLTVSKKIAQKLGGDLILDKSYTQGARFILSLPLEQDAPMGV